MATITLYKDKINGVGSLLDDIIKASNNLNAQLGTLKNTLQGVDSSTCNLQDTVDSISSSSKSEKDKVEDLKKLNNKLTEFIEMTTRRDSSAKAEIERAKEDFYTKYKYLKPECEKSTWEHICDGLKSACDWCKENWKVIVAVVLIIAAIVVVVVTAGTALGPIAGILAATAKGILIGAAIGGAVGGLSGYAQNGVKGILPGIINGASDGAIMGAAFGAIGGAGALAGEFFGCSAFMSGLFSVSSKLSLGMLGFDVLALINDFQTRFQMDTGINLGLIDPNLGGFISTLNHKAHENPYYNALQFVAGGAAAFSGGYVKTAACFVAGTLVATINGFRMIEEIKQGDMVLSADENTLEISYKPVLETYVRQVDKLIHLTINGEKIISTEDHPFYIKGKGFIQAVMLWIGAELINNNNDVLTIDGIYRETLYDETCKVYNFQVEDYHTYHVGQSCVCVHNASTDYNLIEPDKYTELSESEVRKILSDRGLNDTAVQDMIDSFDGPIYSREGNPGEVFTITEASSGDASGVFVTRGSAGATPAERINNLALPPNNTALVESQVQLTRSQILLEGKVAPQSEWALIADDGIPRTGGGWQVVTDGGKYTGAIDR